MATTINKHGPYQFQAIVRRKGYPCQFKTFESRQDFARHTRRAL